MDVPFLEANWKIGDFDWSVQEKPTKIQYLRKKIGHKYIN